MPVSRPRIGDANQVELAMPNLAINARDAMPVGGTLRISLRNQRADRSHDAGRFVSELLKSNGYPVREVQQRRRGVPDLGGRGRDRPAHRRLCHAGVNGLDVIRKACRPYPC